MEKKILKVLFIVFLVMVVFTVLLIGYRASIIYKIYKADEMVFFSDNIRVIYEIDYLYPDGDMEKEICQKKGNIVRVQGENFDNVYDFDNLLSIDVNRKEFTFSSIDNSLSRWGVWGKYPIHNINVLRKFEDKSFKSNYFTEFVDIIKLAMHGNAHYFTDENGREAISYQREGFIEYFDKETGIMYESYVLNPDGSKTPYAKFDFEFNVVTDKDVDYGDLSEYNCIVTSNF